MKIRRGGLHASWYKEDFFEDTLENIEAAMPGVDWTWEKADDLNDEVEVNPICILHQKDMLLLHSVLEHYVSNFCDNLTS